MANTYRRYALTGGSSGSLDELDGAILSGGDMAMTMGSNGFVYFHTLNPTSGATENSPFVIAPDTNAGTKRWMILGIAQGCAFGLSYQSSDKPAAGASVYLNMTYGVTFEADMVGSYYFAPTGPTGEVVVYLKKNGGTFATMTVAQGATAGAVFSGGETIFAAGDILEFAFPSPQDATWAGVAITLKGVRS